MAEALEVEAGPAGSTAPDDRAEPSGVATLSAPAITEPEPEEESRAAAGSVLEDGAAGASEPSASVRGVPTWTFAPPRTESAPAPPGPPAVPSAAESPLALFPPAPPRPGETRSSRSSPAVQVLTVPSLGPAGPRRHPVGVALLSVVTLGAYAVVWHARVNREMSEFDARLEVRPAASTLGIAIPWLAGLLTTLAGAAALAAHALRVGPSLHALFTGPSVHGLTVTWPYLMLLGLVAVPYLVLLVPTGAVALVMTLERTRLVQERVGFRPDRQLRPVRRAALLLLPVVGGLWHLGSIQACLNRVWRAAPLPTAPPAPHPR